MTEDAKARDSLPPKPSLWVQGALFAGAIWGTLIAMSGGIVWVDTLDGQLAAWGIPGSGRKPGSAIFYLPLLYSVFLAAATRSTIFAPDRFLAKSVAWAAALFMLDPATRIALYLGFPDFASSPAASLVRSLLPVPVLIGWIYVTLPQIKRAFAGISSSQGQNK